MNPEWHLNKNIPVMFFLAITLQFVYFVNFISKLDSRLITAEKAVVAQDARLTSIEKNVQGQAISLASIDANISHIKDTVSRIINTAQPTSF